MRMEKLEDEDELRGPYDIHPVLRRHPYEKKLIRNGIDEDGSTRQSANEFEF